MVFLVGVNVKNVRPGFYHVYPLCPVFKYSDLAFTYHGVIFL